MNNSTIVKPSEIDVTQYFLSSFGVFQVEDLARKIVCFIIENGDDWNLCFSASDIEKRFGEISSYEEETPDGVIMRGSFETLDIFGFLNKGSTRGTYTVSDSFISKVSVFKK